MGNERYHETNILRTRLGIIQRGWLPGASSVALYFRSPPLKRTKPARISSYCSEYQTASLVSSSGKDALWSGSLCTTPAVRRRIAGEKIHVKHSATVSSKEEQRRVSCQPRI